MWRNTPRTSLHCICQDFRHCFILLSRISSKLIFNLSHWEDIKLLWLMNVDILFSFLHPWMLFHLSRQHSTLWIVVLNSKQIKKKKKRQILEHYTVQTRAQPLKPSDSCSFSFSLQLAMTFTTGQCLPCKTLRSIISERYTPGEDLLGQLALQPAIAWDKLFIFSAAG